MIASIGATRGNQGGHEHGAALEVEGSPQDVAKLLQNAVRSSTGTLASLDDAQHGTPVGVDPARVVVLSPVALEPES